MRLAKRPAPILQQSPVQGDAKRLSKASPLRISANDNERPYAVRHIHDPTDTNGHRDLMHTRGHSSDSDSCFSFQMKSHTWLPSPPYLNFLKFSGGTVAGPPRLDATLDEYCISFLQDANAAFDLHRWSGTRIEASKFNADNKWFVKHGHLE